MRYVKIFLLTLQQVFEQRARSFVWFLLSLFGPVLMILFWRGAAISKTSLSVISSYYFLLIIGGSLLMSHSEENIALIDIQEGRLATYLLKPFSYFISKWLEELPYRILQGSFGLITLLIFAVFLHIPFSSFPKNYLDIFLSLIIVILAITMAQTYKMCLGFISFWTTDAYGIFQFSEMLIFVFAGFIVPLFLFPVQIAIISYILPFSYMIYFPVAAFIGIFSTFQLTQIIFLQLAWISILGLFYRWLWNRGVKAFVGVGQ